MTTRFEDAISVVGPEAKSEVEEIEKELSLEMLQKSHLEELTIKSLAEIEKADVLADEGKDFNKAFQLYVGMFFKLLADNGVKITEDELSKQMDKLFLAITDRSETIQEIPSSENPTEVVQEKADTEKDIEKCDEMWQPLGGSTTFEEAKKFIEANELLAKAYNAYSMFGAMASNIWNKEDKEVTEKVTLINKLFGDFQTNFTVEKLKELSENMENTGVDETVKAEVDALKSTVSELSQKLTEVLQARTASVPEEPKVEKGELSHEVSKEFDSLLVESLKLEGETRKAALQEVINRMGERLMAVHNQLEPEKPELPVNQEVTRAMIAEQVNPLTAQITQMAAQMAQLVEFVTKGQTQVQPPVQKAVVNLPGKLAAPYMPAPAQPMSIADIVRKTTTGR